MQWVPNPGGPTFPACIDASILVHILLNGRQLDLTNVSGQPSTASIEAPGYIWTQSLNEGAVYSPDGFTIQFHGGKVWVLVDPTPAPGSAIWY